MANACVSPRRLFRPYESHASTHAARPRARCASLVAHITWICRAFTGVQESLSTGDAPRSRYGSSKGEGAAVAARSCGRHPSRRPRPRDRIPLTCAAPRACARAGSSLLGAARCCCGAAGACVRLQAVGALEFDGARGQALRGTWAGGTSTCPMSDLHCRCRCLRSLFAQLSEASGACPMSVLGGRASRAAERSGRARAALRCRVERRVDRGGSVSSGGRRRVRNS